MKRHYNYFFNTDLFSCELNKFKKLLKTNPKPIVKMKKNKCIVTWYEIETHHGIYKRTYEIDRFLPYHILKITDNKILTINPEFIY